jgi:predicted kinase
MIKLIHLLNEVLNKPKAIFLAGPAGSGKSYISKQLLPSTLNVINIDDSYEELLKKSGLGMKQKDFTPDELSQAAKLMGQAQKITREKYTQLTQSLQDVLIDGTGAAEKPLLKKKQELEDLGYDTMMLMIYVSPLTSLERNKNRDRSLMPSIVLRTWAGSRRNIDIFKREFGDNFILINNDPNDTNKSFSLELIQPYIQDSTSKGKPKTPEEQAKSDAEKAKLNSDIEQMVKTLPEFDTIEDAKQKINSFLS